jgi:aldose 1-epimerase
VSDALEVVRLGDDDVAVEVLPGVGARFHRIRAFGVDVLRTPDDPRTHVDDPWFWGSYPLVPWCNRLPTGPVVVAGRTVDLPANFPDGTAIHGQVARAAWRHETPGTFAIEAGDDGWPWRYAVRQTVEAGGGELRLALTVRNLSDGPMPAGLGIHPWFRDPVDVAIRAASVHASNLDSSPAPEPVSGDHDRRELGPLTEGVDATWTDLDEPPIRLAWLRDGIRATIETSESARYVVAARLAGVDATAVEPETHAPAGLRRLLRGEPGGLQLVSPGEALDLTVRIRFSREGRAET